MRKQLSTKKALLASMLSMLLCVAMLLGSTYAWFTDTATTAVNTIQAGKLDVELWQGDTDASLGADALKWVKADGHENEEVLWEPGCTYSLESFRIKNNGNLALKYTVVINGLVGSAKLLEAIDFTVTVDGDALVAKDGTSTVATVADLSNFEGTLSAGAVTGKITITGKMKTDAGNEYQGLKIDGIAITVVATQDNVEYDGNDNTYDETATYLNTDADGNILITSEGDLRYFAAIVNADNDAYAGKTVKLTTDIDLGGAEWTPINMQGINDKLVTFDGNGKTISNFTINVEGGKNIGFFGIANFAIVKNLTIDNATVNGINHVGAIVGHGMVTEIDNCTVKNSKVTTSVYKNDDGDKAGAVIGWTDEGINKITNCTVDNCVVTGYRDIGGLVGYVGTAGGAGQIVTGNTVKNTKVIQNLTGGYQSSTPTTVGEIIGRMGDGFTLDTTTNTATGVTISTVNE